MSKKRAQSIDKGEEINVELLEGVNGQLLKMQCRVVKQGPPPIIWDDNRGTLQNILANIGVIPDENISVVDAKGNRLGKKELERLGGYKSKIRKSHPDELQKIAAITAQMKHNDATAALDSKRFIPRVVQEMLETLHSHRRDGSQDHLYAVLQYAAQKAGDCQLNDMVSALEELPQLEKEVDNQQKKRLKLNNAAEDLKKQAVDIGEKLVEDQALSEGATLDPKKMSDLKEKNTNLRSILRRAQEKKSEKKLVAESVEKEVKVESTSLWGWMTSTVTTNFETVANAAVVAANSAAEYVDYILSDEIEAEALRFRAELRDEIAALRRDIAVEKSRYALDTQEIEQIRAQIVEEKEKQKTLTKENEQLDNTLFELSVVMADSRSNKKITERISEKKEELPIVDVLVGKEKEFKWNQNVSVADNVHRLLKDYLESPRYRTRDRVKSAQVVLEKIKKISEQDPIKRDKAVLDIIREEHAKISSTGLTGKPSVLHAIYRQAEKQFRVEVASLGPNINELNRRVADKRAEVEALTEGNERRETRVSKLKIVLSGQGQKSVKKPGVNREYESLLEENRELNGQIADRLSEGELKKVIKVMNSTRSRLRYEVGELKEKNKDVQHELVTVEKELKQLQSENKKLENDIRIRYIETGQKAKEFHLEKVFNKYPNPEEADPNLLIRSIDNFLSMLKGMMGIRPKISQSKVGQQDINIELSEQGPVEPEANPEGLGQGVIQPDSGAAAPEVSSDHPKTSEPDFGSDLDSHKPK